ncbi:MAG TPA: PKD domain-containing protein [Gemmatimonadaceae bacterium]|nr:PKD domain-containing protein [Gemmatimonadaceae bacterium]
MSDAHRTSRAPTARRRATSRVANVALLAAAFAALAAVACREPVAPGVAPPHRLAPAGVSRTISSVSVIDIFPGSPGNGIRGDARALNSSGVVTGAALGLQPNSADGRPYRWDPGSTTAVQIGGSTAGTAWGSDINDAGEVAGTTQTGTGVTRAFRATGNAMVILDTLPGTTAVSGWTAAYASNNSGKIVGAAASGTSPPHAVLWNAANQIQDLGTLGGTFSQATDINDAGLVIGTSTVPNDPIVHWFTWLFSGPMHDAQTLFGFTPSFLLINNAGEYAGTYPVAGGQSHAFIFTATGFLDLGTLGGQFSEVTGFNSANEVVGNSTTAGGAMHAFLWTPLYGMDDITAKSGITQVHGLNVVRQTLTGSANFAVDATPPKLVQLTIPNPNYPPFAYFTVKCPTLQCTFDASGSTDDSGVVQYTWDWGTGPSESFSTPIAQHTFPAPGLYTVTLTVTDAAGLTSTMPLQFTVPTPVRNQPPLAFLRPVNCTGQPYPHQCEFDASPSSDDYGIVSYRWKWGDGRSETHSRPTVRNTWKHAGTYLVDLLVADAEGKTSGTQLYVDVP